MTLRHSLMTKARGMHPSDGFSTVGSGVVGSGAAVIEGDRTDSVVWLAPGGAYADGDFALRIDSSAWTALGVLNFEIGSALAPTVFELVIPDGYADAFLVEDQLGRDYLAVRTAATRAIQLGNAALDPELHWLGDGPWRINGAIGSAGQILTSNGAGAAPTWQSIGLLSSGLLADEGVWFKSALAATAAGGANQDPITFATVASHAGSIRIEVTARETAGGGSTSKTWFRWYAWKNNGGAITLTELNAGACVGGDAIAAADATVVAAGNDLLVRCTAGSGVALNWTCAAWFMRRDD